MAKWTAFPYDEDAYHLDGASLKKKWARLHLGDAEPAPKDAAVLAAWALFHAGEFQKACEAGLKAGGAGITVANKAQSIHANYLEKSEKNKLAMFQEVAARAEALALLRAEATGVGAPLRERALRELGPLPDRELTPLLAEGLRDPRPPVQLQAAESLAEHGDRSVRSLLHPLLESPHRELAVTAAESLLRLGDSTAEAPLRRHLSDASVPLRVRAALALCRGRNPEAARLLRTLAGSEVITPARRPARPAGRRRARARGSRRVVSPGATAGRYRGIWTARP